MTRFLAWIVPVERPEGVPTPPIFLPPESGGVPTHPIFYPPEVSHPIVLPPWVPANGTPEHPIVSPPDAIAPGVPSHPIVLPLPPGVAPPHVEHPIVGTPEHPIYVPIPGPGDPPVPIDGVPTHPIYIPFPPPVQPGVPGVPTHPIVLPPDRDMSPDAVLIVLEDSTATPPAGVPTGAKPAVLWYGPGTVAAVIWVPPPGTPKSAAPTSFRK